MNQPSVTISLVCAMDENRLIGKDNALPWRMPADLAFFKKTTMGKPILMGRKTWESIGRPLPGRQNIVISRDSAYTADGCDTASGIEGALHLVKNHDEAMLIGGANLYSQVLDIADILYITEIHHQFEGDTWFPEIDFQIWKEDWRENHKRDEKNLHDYSFVKYVRAKSLKKE